MALKRLKERVCARKIVRWYRLIRKMIIIKRNPAKVFQYDELVVTKIQGVIRGWLERRRKVLKRYLKGLYA